MFSIFKQPRVPQANTKGTSLYQYRLGRRFDPGAEAEVFERPFNDPVVLFRGNGRLAGALSVFQNPQVWVLSQGPVAGLGGIQAGQVVGQPLLDPSQITTEAG